VVPDRSLATLGSYVDFPWRFYHKKARIPAGSVGIIVRDTRSLCKTGEVAVRVSGWLSPYFNVPLKDLVVRRGTR
jgi:hypothetical protein